jgi:hypothetical protein
VLSEYFNVARYDRIEGDAMRGLEAARSTWRRVGGQAD